jgi:hypothetical protein
MPAPPAQTQPSPQPSSQQKTPVASPTPTAQPAVAEPPSNAKFWYVYGVVTYDDVFGDHHRTKFCYRAIPGTGVWFYCPTYNEAD